MVPPSDLREPPGKPQDAAAHRNRGIKGLIVLMLVVWGVNQAWSAWKDHAVTKSLEGKAQADDILMLTTSTCPYCAAARRWMDKHEVSYRECDVETDAACRAQYESKGSPGVPLLKVKGRWQLGFDPQWLVLALNNPSEASPSTGSQAQP